MKSFGYRGLGMGVLLFLMSISACKRSEDVKYREVSEEDTATVTKDVFASEAGGSSEKVPEDIDLFFEKLGMATRGEGEIVIENHLSPDAMIESMKSAGLFDSFNRKFIDDFERGFKKDAGSSFGIALRQTAYDRHRVLKVERLDRNERLVYVRHYDNELNITTQMRWWLVLTENGWRIYDFEDLSMGLRIVNFMGTVMSGAAGASPEPWIADFLPLAQAIQTVDFTDVESALTLAEPVEKFCKHELPPDIRRFASMMRTSMLQLKEDGEGSVAELEAAMEGGYESPLHHYLMGGSLMLLGKYEEALDAFGKHAETFGWDSDVLEGVSDCHFQLGDMKSASQAALDGLADNPASINCLCSLAAASSPEVITSEKFRKFIDQCGDPPVGFELAFDYILDMELLPQAEAMLSIMTEYLDDGDLMDYYQEAVGELKTAGLEE